MPWQPILEKDSVSNNLALLANGDYFDDLDISKDKIINIRLSPTSVIDDDTSDWLKKGSTDELFDVPLEGGKKATIEVSVNHNGGGQYGTGGDFRARYNGVDKNKSKRLTDPEKSGSSGVDWSEEVKVPAGGDNVTVVADGTYGGACNYSGRIDVETEVDVGDAQMEVIYLDDFDLNAGDSVSTSDPKTLTIPPTKKYVLEFEIEAGEGQDAEGSGDDRGDGAKGGKAKGEITLAKNVDEVVIDFPEGQNGGSHYNVSAGDGGDGAAIKDGKGNALAEVGGGGGGAYEKSCPVGPFGEIKGASGGNGGEGGVGGVGGTPCYNSLDGDPGGWNSDADSSNSSVNRTSFNEDGTSRSVTFTVKEKN